jgi:hypothetical protein
MPANRQQLRNLLRRSRALRDPARRFVDLAIQFRIEDGPDAGQLTRVFGGVWDRLLKRYAGIWDPRVGDGGGWVGAVPEKIRTVRVAQQHVEFIEDFWSRVILAVGGRRSGKTTGSLAPKIIILLLCAAGKAGEVLSPTYRQGMNVWKAVLKHTPRHWWSKLLKSEKRMELVNGSSVQILSADREDSARSEGVAWLAVDERQDVSEEAFGNALLSTSDGGKYLQIAETGTIKPELRAHWDSLVKSESARIYPMTTKGNPFIDAQALIDIAEQFLDEATRARELEAKWPDLIGRCYYCFHEDDHVRDAVPAGLADITAAYCREHWDLDAQWIVSADPPCHATISKLHTGELLHVRQEVVIGADGAGGDVRDLAVRCRQAIGGDQAVVIFDPHETNWDDDARKWFRSQGFRVVFMPRVLIEYRLTSVRSRIQRKKLLVHSSCVHLREALREQVYVDGKPDKRTKSRITAQWSYDHIVDALGYGVYKIWPARLDYEQLEDEVRKAA